MSEIIDSKEPLTLEELSDALADATGATREEIERGAEELEIAPPSEAADKNNE